MHHAFSTAALVAQCSPLLWKSSLVLETRAYTSSLCKGLMQDFVTGEVMVMLGSFVEQKWEEREEIDVWYFRKGVMKV